MMAHDLMVNQMPVKPAVRPLLFVGLGYERPL